MEVRPRCLRVAGLRWCLCGGAGEECLRDFFSLRRSLRRSSLVDVEEEVEEDEEVVRFFFLRTSGALLEKAAKGAAS